jgi:transcriptional regulator with XRE-family HTH domain
MNAQPGNLGQKVRHYRRSLGESQEKFGARFGVTRLTVSSWEKGTKPNSDHLPMLTEQLKDGEEALGEGVTCQLRLPFESPVDFEVKVSPLKVSPQKADTIHFEVQITRKVS